jgi:RNA polymerase sigma-70 factor (ECF subfamily)
MPRAEPDSAGERTPARSARAAEGGPAAWIREHFDAVYRYARRRLAPQDAEDVTQETFAALVQAVRAGRPPRDAGAWLLGTVRRRVADVWRRRGRRPPPVQLPEGWEGYARERLPAEALEARELRDLVHTALGFLRPEDAALLRARYREGASTAEMARRLGLSPKAVELRLRRAREAFLQRFLRVGRDWSGTDDRPARPSQEEA